MTGAERFRRSSAASSSASRRRPSSRPTPRWPSGSTGSPPSTPRLAGTERVFDLFCGIGTLCLTLSLRAGEVWAVDISEEAIADAIRNAELNEIENAHFFAGDVRHALRPLAERAPRPGRGRRRPAPRRAVEEVVAPPARAAPAADRLRLVQPDHARAQRALRWSPTATASLRCAPWTCSPTPRTSNASRCSSARTVG